VTDTTIKKFHMALKFEQHTEEHHVRAPSSPHVKCKSPITPSIVQIYQLLTWKNLHFYVHHLQIP